VLRQRVATGGVYAVVMFAAIVLGGWWLAGLFAAVAALSTLEIGNMVKVRLVSPEAIFAVCSALAFVLWPHFESFWFVSLYALLILTIFRREAFSFAGAAVLFAAAFYSSYAFHTLLALRAAPHGLVYVLLVFAGIWGTDTGAFFIGRALGGRKLIPEVSPKKTVSGAFGGFLCAVLLDIAVGGLFLPHGWSLVIQLSIVGAVTSVAGQMGDLVESALKRHYSVKDSGTILPGHGGVLDRFDSLLLAAPIAYHLIILMLLHA